PRSSPAGIERSDSDLAVRATSVVNPNERELLGLTVAENQAAEETLQRMADLQRGAKRMFTRKTTLRPDACLPRRFSPIGPSAKLYRRQRDASPDAGGPPAPKP